jgi:hypothetical protein
MTLRVVLTVTIEGPYDETKQLAEHLKRQITIAAPSFATKMRLDEQITPEV